MSQIIDILEAGTSRYLKERKGDAVYHAVKRAILLRSLTAGQPLLEQQIAAAMGCSQGTVREALLRLQQDGLVTRRGYHGTIVSTTTAEEAAHMVRIRLMLETESARRAAQALSQRDIGALEALIALIKQAESEHDGYALSELDREFHRTIFKTAGMPALEPVLTRCALHVHRYTFGNAPDGVTPDHRVGLPSSAEQHRALMEALMTGNPDAAADAMREHIETVIGFWSPSLLKAVRSGVNLP